MDSRIQAFSDSLTQLHGDAVLSMGMIGSGQGVETLAISDIDILIMCQSKDDCHRIFDSAQMLQQQIFGIRSTKATSYFQKNWLASPSYGGLHVIVVGRDEFDKDFAPISWRLKLASAFIGKNLFLYEIRHNLQLTHGRQLVDEAAIQRPGYEEKFSCFVFPMAVMVFSLLVWPVSRLSFKIWCFKAIKYHHMALRRYLSLTQSSYAMDPSLLEVAQRYRYQPAEYPQSSIKLYLEVWADILRNSSLLLYKEQADKLYSSTFR